MKRREFFKWIGLSATLPLIPQIKIPETPAPILIPKPTVKAEFGKQLWPGVEQWYAEHYKKYG